MEWEIQLQVLGVERAGGGACLYVKRDLMFKPLVPRLTDPSICAASWLSCLHCRSDPGAQASDEGPSKAAEG